MPETSRNVAGKIEELCTHANARNEGAANVRIEITGSRRVASQETVNVPSYLGQRRLVSENSTEVGSRGMSVSSKRMMCRSCREETFCRSRAAR